MVPRLPHGHHTEDLPRDKFALPSRHAPSLQAYLKRGNVKVLATSLAKELCLVQPGFKAVDVVI